MRELIAVHNPAAAPRIAVNLLEGIERLRQFPLQGFEVPLAHDPRRIRDLIVDRYVVRYLVDESTLVILRVWHQRENRPRS